MSETNKWVEIGKASYKVRPDGSVEVYSPSGYQVLALKQLPKEIREALRGQNNE